MVYWIRKLEFLYRRLATIMVFLCTLLSVLNFSVSSSVKQLHSGRGRKYSSIKSRIPLMWEYHQHDIGVKFLKWWIVIHKLSMGSILLMIRNLCFLSAGKQRCLNDFIDIKEEIWCITAIFSLVTSASQKH